MDIQFLGKGCYHVEFLVAEIVMKLLRMGSTRINGIRMHFLQWEPGFDLNAVSEHLSNYFVFSVMFPGLPKEWRPVMPHMASSIAQLIDEESDVMCYVVGNLNLPYIQLIEHKGMTLPTYVRLPAMFQAPPRVQKVKYSRLLNQCLLAIVLAMWSRIVLFKMNKLYKNVLLATLMMKVGWKVGGNMVRNPR